MDIEENHSSSISNSSMVIEPEPSSITNHLNSSPDSSHQDIILSSLPITNVSVTDNTTVVPSIASHNNNITSSTSDSVVSSTMDVTTLPSTDNITSNTEISSPKRDRSNTRTKVSTPKAEQLAKETK